MPRIVVNPPANLARPDRRCVSAVASALAATVGAALALAEARSPVAAGPPPAEPSSPVIAQPSIQLRALADVDRILPGRTFHLVLVLDIPEKWHIYWTNPGAGAAPTTVRVQAPDGFNVGPTRWPRPLVQASDLGDAYAYEGQIAIFVPVTAPPTLADDTARFSAELHWALCAHVCRLGSATVPLTVATQADSSTAARETTDAAVLEHRLRLPWPLADLKGAGIALHHGILTIEAPAGEHRVAQLIPDPSPGVSLEDVTTRLADGRARLTARIGADSGNALGQPMVLHGLLALGDQPTDPSYEFSLPVEAQPSRPR